MLNLKYFKSKWLKIIAFLYFIILLWIALDLRTWKNHPDQIIAADVTAYYSYLPAVFIHGDLTLDYLNDLPGYWQSRIWVHNTSTNNLIFRMTMGLSFLYFPFFVLAHIFAIIGDYPTHGYGEPYALGLIVASIFYCCLGLYFLGKTLSRFFNNWVVCVTLTITLFATNLYIYTNEFAGYSHSFSFFLFAFFIYKSILFYDNPKVKTAVLIGLSIGLIALIRPSNSILVLFFLLFGVYNQSSFKERVYFLKKNIRYLLMMVVFGVLVLVPQLIYWKLKSGDLFYYSYGEEGFFFNDPKIYNILFSFRKGWLVYTPIMSLALIGVFLSYFSKKIRQQFGVFLGVFIPLNLYILASWWCWWFGGSFGNRAFIESYAVMAIPMAVVIDKVQSSNRYLQILLAVVSSAFIYLNIYQSWQYKIGLIHHSHMTKEAYWDTFLTRYPSNQYHCHWAVPDVELARDHGIDTAYHELCPNQVYMDISELQVYKPDFYPANEPNVFSVPENYFTKIYFGKVVQGLYVNFSLTGNRSYELKLMRGDEYALITDTVKSKVQSDSLIVFDYELSEKIRTDQFDRIEIRSIENQEPFHIGHLILR